MIIDIQSILWVSSIHFIFKIRALYLLLLIGDCYQPVGGRRFIVDRWEEGEIGQKRATTTCNWRRVDISHTLDYRSALQHDSHSIDLSIDMLLIYSWSNLGYMLKHTAKRFVIRNVECYLRILIICFLHFSLSKLKRSIIFLLCRLIYYGVGIERSVTRWMSFGHDIALPSASRLQRPRQSVAVDSYSIGEYKY